MKSNHTILQIPAKYPKDLELRLSNNAINQFEDCQASFLYSREIMPKMETKESGNITTIGSLFHDLAEHSFDPDLVKKVMATLAPSSVEDLTALVAVGSAREYLKEPNIAREHKKVVKLNDLWSLTVIPDIRIVTPDNHVHIYDWKTGRQPRPTSDERQAHLYCFADVIEHKTKPWQLTAFFDYVRFGDFPPFKYHYSDQAHDRTANYLSRSFMNIAGMLTQYRETNDIKKIPHTPGDHCTLCARCGNCPAYRAYYVPDMTGELPGPEFMSVDDMVAEYKRMSEYNSSIEARLSVLKRALVNVDERYTAAKDSNAPIPPELEKAHAALLSQGRVVRQNVKTVPLDLFLSEQLPAAINESAQSVSFGKKIDPVAMVSKLVDILKPILPPSVSAGSVSKEILDRHPDVVRVMARAPYFLPKK